MTNSKKKGNAWENRLAAWLASHGFRAWKDGASGGGNREKGDVGNGLDMTIESKAAKTVLLMQWWRQVCSAASKHRNSPVLFIHQDGMGEGQWLVVMHSEDWAEMLKKSRREVERVEVPQPESRDVRYRTERLKQATADLLKVLP